MKTETPFKSGSMDEEAEGDASEANPTEGPSWRLHIRGTKNVFSKYEGVTRGPSYQIIQYDIMN